MIVVIFLFVPLFSVPHKKQCATAIFLYLIVFSIIQETMEGCDQDCGWEIFFFRAKSLQQLAFASKELDPENPR